MNKERENYGHRSYQMGKNINMYFTEKMSK